MRIKCLSLPVAGTAALVWLLAGCAVDQILIGQWYAIQTPAQGACPSLLWHFVVNPERSIGGSLSAGGEQKLATLSGQLAPDDSFRVTAKSVAGDRTAEVTGQFTSRVSTIVIHGAAAGSGCDGQVFKPRLGVYFATQGGGGGGR